MYRSSQFRMVSGVTTPPDKIGIGRGGVDDESRWRMQKMSRVKRHEEVEKGAREATRGRANVAARCDGVKGGRGAAKKAATETQFRFSLTEVHGESPRP